MRQTWAWPEHQERELLEGWWEGGKVLRALRGSAPVAGWVRGCVCWCGGAGKLGLLPEPLAMSQTLSVFPPHVGLQSRFEWGQVRSDSLLGADLGVGAAGGAFRRCAQYRS